MTRRNPTYPKFTLKDFNSILEDLGLARTRRIAVRKIFDDLELEYDSILRFEEPKQLWRMIHKRIKDVGFTDVINTYIEKEALAFAERRERDPELALERLRWVAEKNPALVALAAHGDNDAPKLVRFRLRETYSSKQG